MKYKFKMWNWDTCSFCTIKKENIVDAIYYAWNYEFDTYDIETNEPVLICQEDNEFNSELLESYGLRLIDHEGLRQLQNIETEEIYKADW